MARPKSTCAWSRRQGSPFRCGRARAGPQLRLFGFGYDHRLAQCWQRTTVFGRHAGELLADRWRGQVEAAGGADDDGGQGRAGQVVETHRQRAVQWSGAYQTMRSGRFSTPPKECLAKRLRNCPSMAWTVRACLVGRKLAASQPTRRSGPDAICRAIVVGALSLRSGKSAAFRCRAPCPKAA